MSDSPFFSWPVARQALKAGLRVRRSVWPDSWLQRWAGGMVWRVYNDGTQRVAINTDVQEADFRALDWTNLPPDCVASGAIAGGSENACPLPFSPPNSSSSDSQSPGGSIPTGTSGSSGLSSSGSTTTSTSGYGTLGGSGGGGTNPTPHGYPPPIGGGGPPAGGGGSNNDHAPHPRPQDVWPDLTVTVDDVTEDSCYSGGDATNQEATMQGTVSLSNPAGVHSGPYYYTVKNGGTVVDNGTGSLTPGDTKDWGPFKVHGSPGESAFTFDSHCWTSGSPDIQGSSPSQTMKPWCGDQFACSEFDQDWWGQFNDWEKMADTASSWMPSNAEKTHMCVKWVGFCNNADGGVGRKDVLFYRQGAKVQMSDDGYIALAMPYRRAGANVETVIAIEFYGSRSKSTVRAYRVCTGTTDKYVLYRKP